ncbi:MAG: DUF5666 domain-containing protein [Alphaproteobacteria bacterium]
MTAPASPPLRGQADTRADTRAGTLARNLLLTLMLVVAGCGPLRDGSSRDGGVADRGIGGTGISLADRGIGGTGIVGTVTAFGSVWVNGLRVDLPPTTAVRIEGQSAEPGEVRLGHTVAMTASPGGPTGLTARTLEVRYAVAGPVERAESSSGLVMGQRIDLADAEGTTALTPGRWVAVSGLRRPDGVVDASRVDPWNPARGWVLRGRLDAVTPTTLTVAGVTLRRGLNVAAPPVGSLVRVAGMRAAAGASGDSALAVEPDPFNPFGTAVGALSVETYVDPSGQTAIPGGPRLDMADRSAAAPVRVVIDSVVTSGGGLGSSRAFGAQRLGGRSLSGADPAARAAGLARDGQRPDSQRPDGQHPDGPPGPGGPGMDGAPPEGTESPNDAMRAHPGYAAPGAAPGPGRSAAGEDARPGPARAASPPSPGAPSPADGTFGGPHRGPAGTPGRGFGRGSGGGPRGPGPGPGGGFH